MKKECIICHELKPFDNFYRRSRSNKYKNEASALQPYCKPCWIKRQRGNPKALLRLRNAYKENPEKFKLKQKWAQYRLKPGVYKAIIVSRGNSCEICNGKQTKSTNALAVDHNHVSGYIRGILCHKCNRALGLLNADNGIALLQKAISYLESTNNWKQFHVGGV